MKHVNVILFDDFETLDAFGPVEIIGRLPDEFGLGYYSANGGIITSRQRVRIDTLSFSDMSAEGILLIPGGQGTRKLVEDPIFIGQLSDPAEQAEFVLSVCTGSALLAKTGLLNGRKATSNKRAFDWVQSVNSQVNWVKQARWVVDGKFYTSSGVTAGMDMAVGFIRDLYGIETAEEICKGIEYIWNADNSLDPFSIS